MENIFNRILDALTERKRDAIWGLLFTIVCSYIVYSLCQFDLEPLDQIIRDVFPSRLSYSVFYAWMSLGITLFIILALIMFVTVMVALLPDNQKKII